MTAKIKIEKNFLVLRDEIKDILRKISQANSSQIVIDFTRVEFISRSFADELLNLVAELENKGMQVKLSRLNPNLRKMLQIVKNTKKEIKSKIKQSKRIKRY